VHNITFCSFPRHSFETVQDAVNSAALYPPGDPSHLSALAKVIESDCKDSWADLVSAKKQVEAADARSASKKRTANTPAGTTQRDAIIHEMTWSPEDAYGVFASQPSPKKKQEIETVTREMVDLKELQRGIRDAPTALHLLEQFNSDLMNQAYGNRVVNSKEVAETGSIVLWRQKIER
jgi:hypothetical protein